MTAASNAPSGGATLGSLIRGLQDESLSGAEEIQRKVFLIRQRCIERIVQVRREERFERALVKHSDGAARNLVSLHHEAAPSEREALGEASMLLALMMVRKQRAFREEGAAITPHTLDDEMMETLRALADEYKESEPVFSFFVTCTLSEYLTLNTAPLTPKEDFREAKRTAAQVFGVAKAIVKADLGGMLQGVKEIRADFKAYVASGVAKSCKIVWTCFAPTGAGKLSSEFETFVLENKPALPMALAYAYAFNSLAQRDVQRNRCIGNLVRLAQLRPTGGVSIRDSINVWVGRLVGETGKPEAPPSPVGVTYDQLRVAGSGEEATATASATDGSSTHAGCGGVLDVAARLCGGSENALTDDASSISLPEAEDENTRHYRQFGREVGWVPFDENLPWVQVRKIFKKRFPLRSYALRALDARTIRELLGVKPRAEAVHHPGSCIRNGGSCLKETGANIVAGLNLALFPIHSLAEGGSLFHHAISKAFGRDCNCVSCKNQRYAGYLRHVKGHPALNKAFKTRFPQFKSWENYNGPFFEL